MTLIEAVGAASVEQVTAALAAATAADAKATRALGASRFPVVSTLPAQATIGDAVLLATPRTAARLCVYTGTQWERLSTTRIAP